ncbi:hypothetical protein V6N12_031489 [Hibiscus sabdariffa]|uniref:Uncharacterized protein n=1 Tax=Hibiscus sabdariffa TaxID=183260 RepID=A0ABR2CPF9_9ROSI
MSGGDETPPDPPLVNDPGDTRPLVSFKDMVTGAKEAHSNEQPMIVMTMMLTYSKMMFLMALLMSFSQLISTTRCNI